EELAGFHRAQAKLLAAFDPESVSRVIVAQAVQLLGAKAACMTAADGRVLAAEGSTAELTPGDPDVVRVPVRGGWLAVQASRATPFFGVDENELLQALCDTAVLALERTELFVRDRASREALQQRESQLAQAQRLARLGSWEWQVDTGRVLWSAEMYRIYDLEPTDIDDGVDYGWFRSRSHPADTAAMEAAVMEAVASGGRFELMHRIIGADGRVKWLHSRGRAEIDADGVVTRLQGTAQDVTATKEFEEQLTSAARLQAALAQLGQRALHGLDLARLVEDSLAVVRDVLGVDRAELLRDAVPDEPAGSAAVVVIPGQVQPYGALRVERATGEVLGPRQLDFLTSVANILAAAIQRHDTETALAHQALHDPLTGLPNRALLLDRLAQAAARGGRQPAPLAVLFLDLDRFKVVNDGLGHRAGDELLQAVANRLLAVVRPGDTVARLGGDEFVVLCEHLPNDDQAVELADRIAEVLSRPVTVSGRDVTISASVGIVIADAGHVGAEELLRDADTAMYQAKAEGRARFALFDPPSRRQVMDRLETEVALRRAIDRGDLRLCYQPELSLDDGRIVGLEALLRWQHPEKGLQLPGQFLPLAEETGLIVPIGEWALEEACRMASTLQRANRPSVVWVNLSGRQLAEPGLPSTIARILGETGADPTSLGLEITESVIMGDTRLSEETLRTLKGLGVRIAIDDFGTGFSSLSRLRSFPVDALKVDRSFVAGISHDEEDSAIVVAVVGLARSLGMSAVAEGVETLEQAAALRAIGCDAAQGFYFSPPVDEQSAVTMLGDGGGLRGRRVPITN
ncbi:MAG TPA: EAL domain-containing protein, partial [Acidimicrobiia bacterium]|nr:EAL domain-containing protein [Acidimicrobiia bacterium]